MLLLRPRLSQGDPAAFLKFPFAGRVVFANIAGSPKVDDPAEPFQKDARLMAAHLIGLGFEQYDWQANQQAHLQELLGWLRTLFESELTTSAQEVVLARSGK